MSVIVLQHEASEGPGRIAHAVSDLRVIRIDRGEPVPAELGDARGLIVMGGSASAYQPRMAGEIALLARACSENLPVLGICLGSQLLAAALGAEVRRAPSLELGWLPVTLEDTPDPLFAGVPKRFRALHWHGDAFALPAGATHLASSAMTAHQAFRVGRAWGLLFHLEADAAQVAAMAAAFPDDVPDARALVAESEACAAEVAPIADAVFGRWAALIR